MVIAILLSVMAALNSCSYEHADNEPTTIIVGTWTQDGDDDIFVINANGIVHETITDDTNNRKGHFISVSISL